MNTPAAYALIADFVLWVHTLVIVFVAGGLLLIVAGIFRKWNWVRNFWFRSLHLLTVMIVAILPLTDQYCPLTVIENRLRTAAGQQTYAGGFIQQWIHNLIYYNLPLSLFAVFYTLFALVVLCIYIVSPPRQPDFFFWRKKT